jgi:hypothetical protein
MDNSVWAMLNEPEKALLRAAEPKALAALDEDELLDLHTRIRRARTKYATLYRRRAAGQVGSDAARGRASATHARTRVKAEAFEEVLARVSRAVAKAAKASADQLKAERLAAARAGKGAPVRGSAKTPRATASTGAAKGKAPRKTPASQRATASTRAAKGRTQAKRDAR